MRRQFMLILAVGLATGSQGVAAAAPSRAPAAAPAPARARPEALEPVTRTAFLASLDSSFKAADTNRDGVLSQSEIAAAEAKVIQQRLAAVRASSRPNSPSSTPTMTANLA